MSPETFRKTVQAEYAALAQANTLINHVTADGQQVAILQGVPAGEQRSHFVVITAPNTDPADRQIHTECFPTGSTLVRHPSYDTARGGRLGWTVATHEGRVAFPPEQAADAPVRLGAAALRPASVEATKHAAND